MAAGLLAETSPPIEVWTEGSTFVLIQIDAAGDRQEIRIPRERIDGVIQVLQQTRDDA